MQKLFKEEIQNSDAAYQKVIKVAGGERNSLNNHYMTHY